jgi:hypothetical protein
VRPFQVVLKLVVLFLVALVAMQEAAFGGTVTATITGTVTSGTDRTGIFVGSGANLAGLPYGAPHLNQGYF